MKRRCEGLLRRRLSSKHSKLTKIVPKIQKGSEDRSESNFIKKSVVSPDGESGFPRTCQQQLKYITESVNTSLPDDNGHSDAQCEKTEDSSENESTAVCSSPEEGVKVTNEGSVKRNSVALTCPVEPRSEDSKQRDTFKNLFERDLISAKTLAFTTQQGFKTLTPVQEAVLPILLAKGRDVAVEASTGSGKTLAFLIPIVEILHRKRSTRTSGTLNVGAVCVAPTRELVKQIDNVLHSYLLTKSHDTEEANICSVGRLVFTGGKEITKDVALVERLASLLSTVIVVGSPGRLSSLIDELRHKNVWSFVDLEMLVFDEADRLLSDDAATYGVQVSNILSAMPKQRRTCLFSATLPRDEKAMVRSGLHDPVVVRISSDYGYSKCASVNPNAVSTPNLLKNYYVILPRAAKWAFLFQFLATEIFGPNCQSKAIIFFLTCAQVEFFYSLWTFACKAGLLHPRAQEISRLHGRMSQKVRSAAYRQFRQASTRSLLVATDVAARGLDIPAVNWIIQFDAPSDPAMFVHRIGRTARAGKHGQSLLLLTEPESCFANFVTNREVNLSPFVEYSDSFLVGECGGADSPTDSPPEAEVANDGEPLMDKNVGAPSEKPFTSEHLFPTDVRNRFYTVDLRSALLQLPDDEQIQTAVECPPKDKVEELFAQSSSASLVSYDNFHAVWKFFRAIFERNRTILLNANAAYVAYIRAYKEYQLQFLFPFASLELGDVAAGMALPRAPRVREILGKPLKGLFAQSRLDVESIPFETAAAAENYEKLKEVRAQKRERQEERVKALKKKQSKPKIRHTAARRRAKRQADMDEWESLAREEKVHRRLKRGKMTQAEFDNFILSSKKDPWDDVKKNG